MRLVPNAKDDRVRWKTGEASQQRVRRGIRQQVVYELDFGFQGELCLHEVRRLPGTDQRA